MHQTPQLTDKQKWMVCFRPSDEGVLDIPPFNRSGYLPHGIHDACFEEVIERLATNPSRKVLGHQLEKFLLKVIDSENFAYAYIDGEFTTAKASPREIDLILQTQEKFGIHAFRAMEEFLNLGLDSIQEDYSVRLRFWFNGNPQDLNLFRDYFQDLSSQKASALATPHKLKKGIIRIKL